MRRRTYGIVILLTGVAAIASIARRPKSTPVDGDWPVNLAHRGASARAPENTLEAFRAALEDGAGGLETDAHMTHDGEIVLIHDDTVERTTDGRGFVREMTLEEIQALDAGYGFGDDADFPYRARDLRISTLREVYEEFPGVPINIDIKEAAPGIERAVFEVVRSAGAEGHTLIASYRHGIVERFRHVSGGAIPTAASRREIEIFLVLYALRLTRLLRPVYVALQVPVEHRGVRIVTRSFVEVAHALGVRVDVWTIDDEPEMRWLLDLGVDVIMTNRPAMLAKVLQGPGA